MSCFFFSLMHDLVQRAAPFETKKEEKELQEVCQRVVDTCVDIAASQLEHKSILSRNLTVRPGSQADVTRATSSGDDEDAGI